MTEVLYSNEPFVRSFPAADGESRRLQPPCRAIARSRSHLPALEVVRWTPRTPPAARAHGGLGVELTTRPDFQAADSVDMDPHTLNHAEVVAITPALLHDVGMGNPSTRPRQHRPSIKTVAALAGVSWSTVSNVINNHPNVRPQTRAKVEEAIEALGYQPNPAGRNLRRGTTGTAHLLVAPLTHRLNAEIAEAVITQCRLRGQTTIIETAADDPEQVQRVMEHSHSSRRDGTITIGSQPASLPSAVATIAPLVVITAEDRGHESIAVTTDLHREISSIVDELTAQGAHDIALAAGRTHTAPFLDLFVQILQDHGATPGAGAALLAHSADYRGGLDLARRLPNPRPDAVVCVDASLASGLQSGLRSLGIDRDPIIATLRSPAIQLSEHPDIIATHPDVDSLATAVVDTLTGSAPASQIVTIPYALHK